MHYQDYRTPPYGVLASIVLGLAAGAGIGLLATRGLSIPWRRKRGATERLRKLARQAGSGILESARFET